MGELWLIGGKTVLKRPLRKGLLIAAMTLLLGPMGSAEGSAEEPQSQDLLAMSVEQLMTIEVATVVGASKYEQKVTEAPASVSIVTADEIRKYGYRTLAEALRSVRGIYVTYDRTYDYLGLRGFNRPGDYNSRVLLLVDGHRINDNIFDTAPIGTDFPLDLDLVDRIEVIRGPSSSLYGTNAFFGVINVVTRRPADLHGVESSASAGSQGNFQGRLSYGKEFANGVGLLLSASGMHADGHDNLFYPEFGAINGGRAHAADADRNYRLYGTLEWRDVTLVAAYASRTKNIPTASFDTIFGDNRLKTTDSHGFLDLTYRHEFADQTQLTARGFYDRYAYHGDYPQDREPANADTTQPPAQPRQSVLNKDLAWGTWWGGELQLTRMLPWRNKVSAGSEFRVNSRQHQENYDQSPYQVNLDDRRSSQLWALYLQDDLQLLDNLILSAGVRYDHYGNFGGSTNPRLGLIYQPVPGSTFKLLYGSAFRAPNAYELYYDDRQTILANPALRPERIETYEAVYEQYFLEHYRSSLSGFYYRVRDLITSRPVDPLADNPTRYVNADAIDAHGVELELEGKWSAGLEGRLSYTYQEAADAGSGAWLSNSPRHLAKANLSLTLCGERLVAAVEEQYQSTRLTLAGNRTKAALVTNLTLSAAELVPGLRLSASVYNLFAEHYADPGTPNQVQDAIAQDGRTFRMKLEYRF